MGKSTLLETIAIKPKWYTDNLGPIDNKDVILRMRSKLIIENSELTMFDKSDPNTVKAFLSRQVDRDRMPYERLPRDLPRQCLIMATTNKDRFLQDETGNRRMWPVEVKFIKEREIRNDIPQIYAEAIMRYKKGEQLFIDTKEALKISEIKQSERYNMDDWEPEIAKWIKDNNKQRATIGDIWYGCMGRDIVHLGVREQRRIGKVLRRLGWKKSQYRDNGTIVNGFIKPIGLT